MSMCGWLPLTLLVRSAVVDVDSGSSDGAGTGLGWANACTTQGGVDRLP